MPRLRHGSNPARIRVIRMVRPERAEIFALPVRLGSLAEMSIPVFLK